MKKLVLSIAIASTLGLTACGDESIKDVQQDVVENGSALTSPARVVFNPTAGELSVPNDLLFQGTLDGTLNPPVDDPTNGADPFVAISALDGWSISTPFSLAIDVPTGIELDADSIFNPESVRVFEVEMGASTTDAECSNVTRGFACKVISELTWGPGGDFITQKSGNSIAVIPLKPLKAKATYILALTDNLKDSNGRSVAGSTTYELVKQDLATKPLGSDAQKGLQAVINSFETVVSSAGVNKDSIIYSMAMTTQSTVDVLGSVKALYAANLQQNIVPTLGIQDSGISVADALNGLIPAELVPLYSTANYMQGSITLPYYSGMPSAENLAAPVNTWWKALCDSGAMLAGLAASNPSAIPVEAVSEDDATCMAISQANGLPAPGLRDIGIDTERNLTKFNPIPEMQAMTPLSVQVTTPDLPVANAVRAGMGLPMMEQPENGWPVVVLVHGITSKKEEMLPITGILSLNGLATVAIDHPLHGSRGFDLDPTSEGDEINASTESILHYVNLASMLTMRDNTRQSVADLIGLRLGVNFSGGVDGDGNPINLDGSKVHLFGHSLGAIYGMNTVAMSNAPLNPAVDSLFKFSSTSLAMPGLMLANFGIESPAFEGTVKSNLTYQASPEFKAFVDAQFDNPTQKELSDAFFLFYDNLSAEQQAGLDGTFASFTFASQTVTDSGDPIAYVNALAATQTPIHLIEVVGNGVDNLSDQTVTNTAPNTPMGGTEPAIALLGLPSVSETSQGSGVVRFIAGHHNSILDPRPNAEASPDPIMSARATQEMQTQVAGFFASMGQLIPVTDTGVVLTQE